MVGDCVVFRFRFLQCRCGEQLAHVLLLCWHSQVGNLLEHVSYRKQEQHGSW